MKLKTEYFLHELYLLEMALGFQNATLAMCCRVRTCCCGCTLEAGCKAISIVGLIWCIIALIGAIYPHTDPVNLLNALIGLVSNGLLLHGVR